MSFSRDGRLVVGTLGDEVRVWESRSGAGVLAVEHTDPTVAPQISADGRVVLVARRDGTLAVYDVATATSSAPSRRACRR